MKRDYHKADCLFRTVWALAFIVLGVLYIPWLAFLGALIGLSLLVMCTRLSNRFRPFARNAHSDERR